MAAEIPDGNLFMACRRPVREAFSPLPDGYFLRPPRREELPLWMDLHFDGPETARQYRPYMERYFAQVYAPHGDLFFERCRLLCAPDGEVAGTCFVWKAYGRVNTVHWFKVKREREGAGWGGRSSRPSSPRLGRKTSRSACTPSRGAAAPSSCTATLASAFSPTRSSAEGQTIWSRAFPSCGRSCRRRPSGGCSLTQRLPPCLQLRGVRRYMNFEG